MAFDFWYVVPIITIALAAIIYFDYWRDHKLHRSSINEIDLKEIGRFITHLTNIIVRLGYIIDWVKYKDDHEFNMVAVKDGVKVLIRAIRNEGTIGWKPIQESLNVTKFHGCHMLIMVTNKHFTFRAKEFAALNGVVLWDREELVKNLLDTKEEVGYELEAPEAVPSVNAFVKAKYVLSMDEYLSNKCGLCGSEVNNEDIQFCNDNAGMLKGGVYCKEHRKGVK